jgi:hypothetical protein
VSPSLSALQQTINRDFFNVMSNKVFLKMLISAVLSIKGSPVHVAPALRGSGEGSSYPLGKFNLTILMDLLMQMA